MRYLPNARFGFIMILRVLMQFKLSSCFATHSEAVLVVDCPNLNRAPAFIPPLYPSSITLAALVLFAPFLSSPVLIIPPNLACNIYTLQQKSSIFPYKSRRTYGRIYPSNFFRGRQKERKEMKNSTRLALQLARGS